jgi:ferredoxin
MSYQIPDECPACGACLSNCPTDAITVKDQKFYIDPKLCNYCEGYYPEPQCIIGRSLKIEPTKGEQSSQQSLSF